MNLIVHLVLHALYRCPLFSSIDIHIRPIELLLLVLYLRGNVRGKTPAIICEVGGDAHVIVGLLLELLLYLVGASVFPLDLVGPLRLVWLVVGWQPH